MLCPGQESNLHDQIRSLGPQPSASTNSATWAARYVCELECELIEVDFRSANLNKKTKLC
jgi:hypothetical protein